MHVFTMHIPRKSGWRDWRGSRPTVCRDTHADREECHGEGYWRPLRVTQANHHDGRRHATVSDRTTCIKVCFHNEFHVCLVSQIAYLWHYRLIEEAIMATVNLGKDTNVYLWNESVPCRQLKHISFSICECVRAFGRSPTTCCYLMKSQMKTMVE